MDELSPIKKIMNSVSGNTYREIEYKWFNTETNYLLSTVNKKEMIKIYNLEKKHFENNKGYYVIKVDAHGEHPLTHSELVKELEL